nr:hypothetical protein [Candidatus Thorarchaeota archaeon]
MNLSLNFPISDHIINILTPREKLPPSEWCEKYVYLPKSVSNRRFGFIKFQKWSKEILDDYVTSPKTKLRVIRSSAQAGKTQLLICIALYNLFCVEQNVFIVLHDDKTAKDVIGRMRKIIKASPYLYKLYDNKKGMQSKYDMNLLNGCSAKIATAGSPGSLRSYSAGCVIIDEVDASKNILNGEGSLIDICEARTNSYGETANIWICSTPTNQYGNISVEYDRSLSHIWTLKCPECNKDVKLDFDQIRYDTKWTQRELEANIDAIEWRCPHCKGTQKQKKFIEMRELGSFVELEGQKDKSSYIKGFHISGMMSAQKTFVDLCRKHQEALHDHTKWQTFLNLELGEIYTAGRKALKKAELMKHIKNDLPYGVAPHDTMLIIKGADVGREEGKDYHFYSTTVAFQPGNRYTII